MVTAFQPRARPPAAFSPGGAHQDPISPFSAQRHPLLRPQHLDRLPPPPPSSCCLFAAGRLGTRDAGRVPLAACRERPRPVPPPAGVHSDGVPPPLPSLSSPPPPLGSHAGRLLPLLLFMDVSLNVDTGVLPVPPGSCALAPGPRRRRRGGGLLALFVAVGVVGVWGGGEDVERAVHRGRGGGGGAPCFVKGAADARAPAARRGNFDRSERGGESDEVAQPGRLTASLRASLPKVRRTHLAWSFG